MPLSAIPNKTGISTCMNSLPMMVVVCSWAVPEDMNSLSQKGVIKMPMRLDILALKMAAGILPPAIDTITTDEDTVEGRAQR